MNFWKLLFAALAPVCLFSSVRAEMIEPGPAAPSNPATSATSNAQRGVKVAAIFVKNRGEDSLDTLLPSFEDQLVTELTNRGLRIISSEDTTRAVRSFLGSQNEGGLTADPLDALLENSTSATRLAQNLGADFLVMGSLLSTGVQVQQINRPDLGINRSVSDHQLRASYKILSAVNGESLAAGTVLASKRSQQSGSLQNSSPLLEDLIADAAVKIGQNIQAKGGANILPAPATLPGDVGFTVVCSVQDMTVPEVTRDDDGNFILTANRYKLEPLAVVVELNGVVIGSAPGRFTAAPGLHRLRLTREGFETWERTINIREGLTLNVAMTLNPQGRQYWMEMAEFFANLKQNEQMAEAQAEQVKAIAQMMRQSGLRIDRRSDVNINTTEAPGVINEGGITGATDNDVVWPITNVLSNTASEAAAP
ncbi:MAG: PEGA domain-containing protein [Opitutales bacterium]